MSWQLATTHGASAAELDFDAGAVRCALLLLRLPVLARIVRRCATAGVSCHAIAACAAGAR
jgi:hypothetical protein